MKDVPASGIVYFNPRVLVKLHFKITSDFVVFKLWRNEKCGTDTKVEVAFTFSF
jgi:hypothetical protein